MKDERKIKAEMRRRLLLDMGCDKIIKIKEQLDVYEKYMTEDSFNNSKEVKELYDELEYLIKIDNVYC